MSRYREARHVLDRAWFASPQQRLARAVVLLSGVLFLVLVGVSGTFQPLVSGLLLVLLVGVALAPETNAGLAAILLLGLLWLGSGPAGLGVPVLLAALDLLVLHVACTLTAHGPPGAVVATPVLRLWWRRVLVCTLATLLVWLAARGAVTLDLPPGRWLVGVALLLLVGWAAWLATRLAERSSD